MGNVLCVDDDRAALATVTRALRTVAPVVAAASVADARAALDGGVAAVVSDYRMPGASGTEFLAEVRMRDPTVGRILLTAYVDADVLMQAINEGHVHRYGQDVFGDEHFEPKFFNEGVKRLGTALDELR